MANIADAAQHIDRLIASKREQIARQARGIVEDMTNLAASAEKGYHLSATPIQHAATYPQHALRRAVRARRSPHGGKGGGVASHRALTPPPPLPEGR